MICRLDLTAKATHIMTPICRCRLIAAGALVLSGTVRAASFSAETALQFNGANEYGPFANGFTGPQISSISDSIPYSLGGTNPPSGVVGTITGLASARSGPGDLGISASIGANNFNSNFPLTGRAGVPADPSHGTFFDTPGAQASFSSENLQFDPVSGSHFTGPANVSLNLNLNGTFAANNLVNTAIFPSPSANAQFTLNVSVNWGYTDQHNGNQIGNFYPGRVTVGISGLSGALSIIGSSGLLSGYTGGPFMLTTPSFSAPLGTPIHLEVRIDGSGFSTSDGNHSIAVGASFLDTLSFPESGAVFNTPDGVTANDPDLQLAGNTFVPEPGVWAAFTAVACAGFGFWRRRKCE